MIISEINDLIQAKKLKQKQYPNCIEYQYYCDGYIQALKDIQKELLI